MVYDSRNAPKWRAEEIAYCSNVHPGTCAADIEYNVKNISSEVKHGSGLHEMYVGLWLSQSAVDEYTNPKRLAGLINTLKEENLKVVTLNGFPQQDFHQEIVKQKVYQPTWAEETRWRYSLALAEILAQCMSHDTHEGTISTLPLAYRIGWNEEHCAKACQNLFQYALGARAVENKYGKRIRLCLEMEPGCVLEKTSQIIHFFSSILPDFAKAHGHDLSLISDYLGICFDICHQAVMQEDVAQSLQDICSHGIVIGKIQVSSALKVNALPTRHKKSGDPASPQESEGLCASLGKFAEPKYMHQVTSRDHEGTFVYFDDLTDFLSNSDVQLGRFPLWVHYHLPVQTREVVVQKNRLTGLSTTQEEIETVLDCLHQMDYAPHIEIETYTWHVLPTFQETDMPGALISGLVEERLWLIHQMKKRQLIVNSPQAL